MDNLEMLVTTSAAFDESLIDFYYELLTLADVYREQTRVKNKKTLAAFMTNISGGIGISDWKSEFCNPLIVLGCALMRDSIISAEESAEVTQEVSTLIRKRADLLCSLYLLIHDRVTEHLGLLVVNQWLMSRLILGQPAAHVAEVISSLSEALRPLKLPEDKVVEQIRAALVLRVARDRSQNELFGIPKQTAREWCAELLCLPHLQTVLIPAAKEFGLSVPAQTTHSDEASASKQLPNLPEIWPIQELLSLDSLEKEFRSVLFGLQAEANGARSCFEPRTSQALLQLGPRAEPDEFGPVFSEAIQELWKHYVHSGDNKTLELMTRSSRYFFRVLHDGKAADGVRANALSYWISAQLPTLIRTAELSILIKDAEILSRTLACRVNLKRLRWNIVEAHAGVCNSLIKTKEVADLNQLRDDNKNSLMQLRSSIEKDSGANDVEFTALWSIIFPADEGSLGPNVIDNARPTTLIKDSGFQDVIRRGAVEGVKDWIDSKYEQIQETLRARLSVQLTPDHLIIPSGVVYLLGPGKKNIDPRFLEAREALNRSDFNKASLLFGRVAERVQGVPRDIARNFQAYALGTLGELVQARQYLNDLCRAGYRSPAVYWNLACCIPAESGDARQQQLQVLEEGLRCAPHPKILYGTVALAMWLENQEILSKWLPRLTIFEALLLSYQLNYDESDFQGRDSAVVQLSLYVRDGEPDQPDSSEDFLHYSKVEKYQNALLERHQPEAFEFWLACRELVAGYKWDYWQAKTDFLDKTQRREEASKAFLEELNCRLGFLRNLHTRPPPPNFVHITRKRAEQWLLTCATPGLRTVGLDIFNNLTRFANASGPAGEELIPRIGKIRTYYAAEPQAVPTQDKGVLSTQPAVAASDLNTVLVRVAGVCFAGLSNVSYVPRFAQDISSLTRALATSGKTSSVSAVERLLKSWETYGQGADRATRLVTLQNAQSAFADFRGSLQRELSAEQYRSTAPLIASFERVSNGLAHALELVPELEISIITEAPPNVSPNVQRSGFSVRVSSLSNDIPVRLVSATATLADESGDFLLRNSLEAPALTVAKGRSAVLSFSVPSTMLLRLPQTVVILVRYELSGTIYTSKPTKISVELKASQKIDFKVPYIWGRALDSVEIKDHFFGRTEEQEAILESIQEGQQRLRYVEGIRRSGKSSLLNSIIYLIEDRQLPIIPVYVSAASVGSLDHSGKILHYFLQMIANSPLVKCKGIVSPTEEQCCGNPTSAYSSFVAELTVKLPDKRVVVLLDDFQTLVAAAGAARNHNPELSRGVVGLLNLYKSNGGPSARILWVFAGQEAFRKYRELLPGALLWGEARPLTIDFLDEHSVGEILCAPIVGTPIRALPETITRIHTLTGGHPEIVQQMAELIWLTLSNESRTVMTPADADEAAVEIANTSDGFADTWYPQGELTRDQRAFVAAMINAVPVGGSIEPFKLLPNNELTTSAKGAIDELIARKILVYRSDGTIGVKAHILDLWLHRYIPSSITEGINGSVAIFIDVANLTSGTGHSVLKELKTEKGDEGVAGRFRLSTIIDRIEKYARTLSPAPVAARWVANYPPRSNAVLECQDKGYHVENIPEKMFRKGADDIKLREKMWDVEQGYPNVNHFLLVAGDVDYSLAIDKLLRDGKFAHLIGRAGSTFGGYEDLAQRYPERFSVMSLEDLLEEF